MQRALLLPAYAVLARLMPLLPVPHTVVFLFLAVGHLQTQSNNPQQKPRNYRPARHTLRNPNGGRTLHLPPPISHDTLPASLVNPLNFFAFKVKRFCFDEKATEKIRKFRLFWVFFPRKFSYRCSFSSFSGILFYFNLLNHQTIFFSQTCVISQVVLDLLPLHPEIDLV
jgi:hypothetical protein